MIALFLNLLFGPKSKHHEYTTTYNGLSFKTRINQLLRRKTYRAGQVIKPGDYKLKLVQFIRYNNCFDEYWECEYVDFKELGKQHKWLTNEY